MLVLCLGMVVFGSPGVRAQDLRRTPVVEAVRRVLPSVVNITSEKRAGSHSRWPFSAEENQRPRVNGMGTGVIIDGRGYILTNQHVVDKVEGIEVHLPDGTSYPAKIVQQDTVMDLAVIKIEAGRPVPAIAVGTSSDLMVGETVISIGNAFGYENTTSVGIISALNRNVTLSDEQVYRNLIQTDACINPGNSGGPLVNIQGELIGINVAVRAGAQGIGFALPIDDVKRVAAEMLSTRRLASTWHGIVAGEIFKGQSRSVVVSEIQSGSPAEAAGFLAGDHLLRIGTLDLRNSLDIERALLDLRPGDKAEVVVHRGGKEERIPLEVRPIPARVATAAVEANADPIWRLLGVKVAPVTREYVVNVSPKFKGGLYVQSVMPGSPAERASILPGDILVGVNDGQHPWQTVNPNNLLYILTSPDVVRTQPMLCYIVRRNEFVQGTLDLAGLPTGIARR